MARLETSLSVVVVVVALFLYKLIERVGRRTYNYQAAAAYSNIQKHTDSKVEE